jgi:hypothetical protein
MDRFFSMSLSGVTTAATLFILHPALAEEGALSTDSKNPARMNCGAQIECVTPDGHAGQVSRLPAQDPTATALIMDDDTITCLLQEGETNFVIELPQSALPDRFTFLNENAGARGELKIAVSNHRLAANSPEWTEVEGIVPFAHKRLFGVSLLGIEAKFVRLSFHVEKEGRIAAHALYDKPRNGSTDEQHESAQQVLNGFQTSGLEDALNSKFATLYSRGGPLLLTSNFLSVAPLPPMSRD